MCIRRSHLQTACVGFLPEDNLLGLLGLHVELMEDSVAIEFLLGVNFSASSWHYSSSSRSFLIRTRVNRLGPGFRPDELFVGRVIHIEDETPDVDGGLGRRSIPPPKPRPVPRAFIAVLIDGDLVAD